LFLIWTQLDIIGHVWQSSSFKNFWNCPSLAPNILRILRVFGWAIVLVLDYTQWFKLHFILQTLYSDSGSQSSSIAKSNRAHTLIDRFQFFIREHCYACWWIPAWFDNCTIAPVLRVVCDKYFIYFYWIYPGFGILKVSEGNDSVIHV